MYWYSKSVERLFSFHILNFISSWKIPSKSMRIIFIVPSIVHSYFQTNITNMHLDINTDNPYQCVNVSPWPFVIIIIFFKYFNIYSILALLGILCLIRNIPMACSTSLPEICSGNDMLFKTKASYKQLTKESMDIFRTAMVWPVSVLNVPNCALLGRGYVF